MNLILIVLILIVLFLPTVLMMRRQSKEQQRVHDMQSTLEVGDSVITGSGIHGVIVGIDEKVVDLDIADNVVVTFERAAVLRREAPAANELNEASESDVPSFDGEAKETQSSIEVTEAHNEAAETPDRADEVEAAPADSDKDDKSK